MIFRSTVHYALTAHWLLIAGLVLYFDKDYRRKSWLSLLLLSSLIHAYLLAMLLTLWIFDLLNKTLRKRISYSEILKSFSFIAVSLYVVMYSIGYFNVSSGTLAQGFGLFRLNLNAIINPMADQFSSIIKPLPNASGDYEGLNYLGFGIISLFIFSLFRFPVNSAPLSGIYQRNLVFVVLCFFLTLFALSSNVSLGLDVLVHIKYPEILNGLTSTFRASGRFFWIVFYGLVTFAIVSAYKLYGKKFSFYILAICLVIQAYDSKDLIRDVRNKFKYKFYIEQPVSEHWGSIPLSGKNIIAIPPSDLNSDWKKWAYFASVHKMGINFGYFARFNKESWDKQSSSNYEEAVHGELKSNNIYIFKNKDIYLKSLSQFKGKSINFQDGEDFIIAPQ